MTRINSAIPVEKLTDEHLLAEHREIKRICNNFEIRLKKNKFDDIPKEFTLGTGHVLFFIDKPIFTIKRYWNLYWECKYRQFNVEDYSFNWTIYLKSKMFFKDYIPKENEYNLLIERITIRINQSSKSNFHYFGKSISKQKAIEILTGNKNII